MFESQRITILLCFLTLSSYGIAAADANRPSPPCSDRATSEFDFWLGEWEAFDTNDDSLQGREHVTRDMGGCVLRQNWTQQSDRYKHPGSDRRMRGTSMTARISNAPAGEWWQTWTDNVGSYIVLSGGLKDGVMTLEGLPGNSPFLRKWHWQPLEDGSVHSWGIASTDNGETWQTVWDITYRRPADQAESETTNAKKAEMP